MTEEEIDHFILILKCLKSATQKAAKFCEIRSNLESGSSRAKVTTANANFARYAESRDTQFRKLQEHCARFLGLNDLADEYSKPWRTSVWK